MRYWIIPVFSLVLSIISLVTVKSVAPDLAYKQLGFFIFGFVLFFIATKIPLDLIKRLSVPGYFIVALLLFILLVTGTVTRGITGWFDLGFVKFQPSQYAIPIVAIFVLRWVETVKTFNLSKVLQLIGIIALPGVLIVLEPDLGTALVYFISLGSVFFMLDIPKKYLINLAILAFSVLIIGWMFFLQPYQRARITSFMDSSSGNQTANYNARQSVIAVGSGGIMGRGVGFGVQSHLKFLPERQTDFIFASFAEEWGLVGSIILVLLYLGLMVSMLYFAHDFTEQFDSLYAVIVATMLAVQAGINIGMNIGLLPITGITLPLISYGGSSITAVFITFGILQNMILSNKKKTILRFS